MLNTLYSIYCRYICELDFSKIKPLRPNLFKIMCSRLCILFKTFYFVQSGLTKHVCRCPTAITSPNNQTIGVELN